MVHSDFCLPVQIYSSPCTRINQDIKFVELQTWKVYEHYVFNQISIKNELGYFNSTFQYVPIIKVIQVMVFYGYAFKIW